MEEHMTDKDTPGIEHLAICLETLHDLSIQLLGDPRDTVASIKRSGVLVPPMPILPKGETMEERDAVAEVKIGLVTLRKEKKDALRAAMSVIQQAARELSKSEPLCERILGA
jgi:hypothetical protein